MNFTNKKIIKKIVNKNYKIVIAESCTGGLLSSEFTKISGVSKSFLAADEASPKVTLVLPTPPF